MSLPTGRLLAIDTATEAMSIALSLPHASFVVDGEGGARASEHLIPEVMALLQRGGCTLAELDAIGFGRGPGAFTGLRTACSVAQGLALGAGKPVLPIDSLLLVAEDARGDGVADPFDVWVAMDARMDEIYAAHYRWNAGDWRTLAAPALLGVDALQRAWQADPPGCVVGNALDAFAGRLNSGAARQLPQARSRAAALGRLAQLRWRAGGAVDAALALPVYVRDKVALTSAERAARVEAEVTR